MSLYIQQPFVSYLDSLFYNLLSICLFIYVCDEW